MSSRVILGVGPDFKYEVLSKEDWVGRRLVADRFRKGRAFRAYDADYNMIDAQVVNGNNPEAAIEKLFRNPKIEFVDARSEVRAGDQATCPHCGTHHVFEAWIPGADEFAMPARVIGERK